MLTLHHGNLTVVYIQQLFYNEIDISNYQSRYADMYEF